jgi:hypothetical protein
MSTARESRAVDPSSVKWSQASVQAQGCGLRPADRGGSDGERLSGSPRPSPPSYGPRDDQARHWRYDMPPGVVPEIVISSSASKLIMPSPPGVIRWTLDGDSCSVDYT